MVRFQSFVRFGVVLALVVSTQGLLLVQGAWLVNQDWITETLCVNRDRPEMNCDGKCQLADRMEQMEHGPHRHDEAPTPLLELALSVRAHVAGRVRVPAPRSEATGAVVAVRGGWRPSGAMSGMRLQAGVENVLDTYYQEHLAISDLVARGRSLYLAVGVDL